MISSHYPKKGNSSRDIFIQARPLHIHSFYPTMHPLLLPSLTTTPLKPFPLLPHRRTKEPARSRRIRIGDLDRGIQIIHIIIRDTHPPPARHGRIGQIDRENDHNRTNRESGIHAGGGDVIKAHPPPSVLVPDVLIEDETHDAPREVIERGRRRDIARAAEDEGSREVSERCAGERTSEGVKEDRSRCACEPEILEVGVDGTGREDALGADETPDDGGVEEDAAVGAVEFVYLVLGADV